MKDGRIEGYWGRGRYHCREMCEASKRAKTSSASVAQKYGFFTFMIGSDSIGLGDGVADVRSSE
jgi:hypothetical protein